MSDTRRKELRKRAEAMNARVNFLGEKTENLSEKMAHLRTNVEDL
jgi:chaperonin cofactor prefoldin